MVAPAYPKPDSVKGRAIASGSKAASHNLPRTPESITSRDNRWLKWFRAAFAGEPLRDLAEKSGTNSRKQNDRKQQEEIAAVEGLRLVEAALGSGAEIIALLAGESGIANLETLGVFVPASARLLITTDRLFAQVSATEAPQGIAALLRPKVTTFDDLICGLPLVLVLAGVQDPGNVGALIRTAQALGASGAAACAAGGIGTANPYGAKALRASAGASLQLPILRGVAAPVLLAQLRAVGIRIYAACPDEPGDTSRDFVDSAKKPHAPWQVDWRVPSALLIGNEGAGLPDDLVRPADARVSIPQAFETAITHGEASARTLESLNAAAAGAILLYEAARQRAVRSKL